MLAELVGRMEPPEVTENIRKRYYEVFTDQQPILRPPAVSADPFPPDGSPAAKRRRRNTPDSVEEFDKRERKSRLLNVLPGSILSIVFCVGNALPGAIGAT